MTREITLVVLLFASFAHGERLTTDKQPLPEPYPRTLSARLPILGTKLDALPEEVCDHLWSADTDTDIVNKIRQDMTTAGIDLEGFNYVGSGIAGSMKSALMVDCGRVRKIILFHPGQNQSVVDGQLKKLASLAQGQPKVDRKTKTITFKMKNVMIYERAVGYWEHFTPGESHPTINGHGSNDIPDRTDSGPAGIEIGVVDLDWQALNVCKDPAMLKAIQAGTLLKGMKPLEAFLTMRDHKLYRQRTGSGEIWSWSDQKVEVQDVSIINGDFGNSTNTHYTNKEKVIGRVTFKSGVVDTIDDETTLSKPPEN